MGNVNNGSMKTVGWELSLGRRDNKVECFVGLNDEHSAPVDPDNITRLVLTHKRDWKYLVECSVDMQDGAIRFF